MRNNEERLGTKDDQSSPTTLSPLEFVSPTTFVKLPSEGLYYPEGHPLHNQETIEIKQMTAKEEDMLTSRALLKKGITCSNITLTDLSLNHSNLNFDENKLFQYIFTETINYKSNVIEMDITFICKYEKI